MRFWASFFLFFYTTFVYATTEATKSYQVQTNQGLQVFTLQFNPELDSFIGGPCFSKFKKCLVKKVLSEKNEIKVHSEDGRNPGALLCNQLKGGVVIGTDSRRNQQSLCLFSDGSFTTTGDLFQRQGGK